MAQGGPFSYNGPAFTKGIELQLAGKEQEAFEQWRKVLQQEPGHPGAFYHAGVGRFNIGEFDKARYNFERSFDYPAKGFNAHYFLGRIAENQKDPARARRHYELYLQLTKSAQGIAEVKGRLAKLPLVEKKKESVPPPVKAVAVPAVPPVSSGSSSSVLPVAKRGDAALKKVWNRAETERKEGNWAEALERWSELLERCVTEGIDDAICRDACYALADTYYETGRLQPAADRYRLALDRWPHPQEDAWGWYQLGNASRGWNHEEALKAYSVVAERYPESRWASPARWKREDAVWKLAHQELIDIEGDR